MRARLPEIQAALVGLLDAAPPAAEQAGALREKLESLRSAASLVGLSVVSGVSGLLESSIDDGKSGFTEESALAFGAAIEAMVSWLEEQANGQEDDREAVALAVVALRRSLGAPEEGDEEALTPILYAEGAEPRAARDRGRAPAA